MWLSSLTLKWFFFLLHLKLYIFVLGYNFIFFQTKELPTDCLQRKVVLLFSFVLLIYVIRDNTILLYIFVLEIFNWKKAKQIVFIL